MKKQKKEELIKLDKKRAENKKIFLKKSQINYQYFDPCNHWCKACNVMVGNVYEYFNHLASEEHKQVF